MAKFSLWIEEDGEGPSNRIAVPKRQRVESSFYEGGSDMEEYDVEEEEGSRGGEASEGEEESEGESEEEEESGAEQAALSPQTTRDGSISITLTDPEVLDCHICYEALTIPVFQCDNNGHIACSACCIKVRNKCPSCSSPIGYSRCRAIEKVLESVKVSCQNTKYGCREVFSYSMKQKHEKVCLFTPCSCPIAGCNFEGSSEQLCKHFGDEHKYSATHFQYGRLVPVTLGIDEKFLVLRAVADGSLFILNNKVETLGNIVTLSRIGASTENGFFYDLLVKAEAHGSTVRFQSFTKSTPKREDSPPSLGCLMVPSQVSCISKQLKMQLRVCHHENPPSFRSSFSY